MFSIAVYSGWKPAPTSSSAETRPSMAMLPSSGSMMRASSLSSVDLPAPLRPTIPTAWPCGISNETPSSAANSS